MDTQKIRFVANRPWLDEDSPSKPGPIIKTLPDWYRKADRYAKDPAAYEGQLGVAHRLAIRRGSGAGRHHGQEEEGGEGSVHLLLVRLCASVRRRTGTVRSPPTRQGR